MNKAIIVLIIYILLAIVTLFQKHWTHTYNDIKIDSSFEKVLSKNQDLNIYQLKQKKYWIDFSTSDKEFFHSVVPSSEDLLRSLWKNFYPDAPIDWSEFNQSKNSILDVKINELNLGQSQKIAYIKIKVRKTRKLFLGDIYLIAGMKKKKPFYISFQNKKVLNNDELKCFLNNKFKFN
ncbi:MAG: hypothetical protein COB02_14195 [Candidatus Cloacimonadota bacterium]|nr:MAG: hypothetical protein COB02_14195 [Candidatus Cloacimonadota bacterium]